MDLLKRTKTPQQQLAIDVVHPFILSYAYVIKYPSFWQSHVSINITISSNNDREYCILFEFNTIYMLLFRDVLPEKRSRS
jgi:hypothetical protein